MKQNPFEQFVNDPTRSVPLTIAKIEKNYNAPLYSLRNIFKAYTGEVNLRGRTDYQLMMDEGKLGLPRMQTRGAASTETMRGRKKSGIYLEVPHYKQSGTLRADDFIGKVEDNTSLPVVYDTIERVLAEHFSASWDDYTNLDEYNYSCALFGKVRDGLDDEVIDIYTRLGIGQQKEWQVDLLKKDYNPYVDCRRITSYIAKALAGTVSTKRIAVCSGSFWDKLITNEWLRETYKYQESQFLRDLNLEGYNFLGIEWMLYDNETIRDSGNTQLWIPDGEAVVVPYGVDNLFMSVNAPADTFPEVTQDAKHRYTNYWLKDDKRTIELETQTNTITFCTRPEALVRMTMKGYTKNYSGSQTFVPPIIPEERRG